VARQRNNIYAIAADAVDLAMDTAGTMASMVGGVAHMVGFGGSEKTEEQERHEADDAAQRVAATLRQELEAAKPKPSSHKAKTASRRPKAHSAKSVKKVAKRTARKAAAHR